ncbi:outer membrane lipoprotein-sorting protein [Streptomyces puniciscabiei]|uniref:Outer membrane lipoprotein-sorting protein n=1 Tax=Streptomyces puniciscabiei TaxID=164348 RepID=A0A542UDV3_9ACTN|nr:sigma-E factor regulatory protein RseB domain-containing protein [Streptomyces puniciscabiei]TQK97216.1 outer membrane lipoprotein-sorting protein [Streptomyces puniciscabiei]
MAPYESDDAVDAGRDEERHPGRRRAARYAVPVAVVGVAAATIGLVPALAASGDPDLPRITAQQLIEKIAKSDVQQLSGTVRIDTDLGLPDLGGLESSLASGAVKGSDGGSSADPQSQLTSLVSGTHTLRVAADGPEKQKLSLLQSGSEYSLIHNGKNVWGYNSKTNEAYHGTSADSGREHKAEPPATPKDFADQALKSVDDTTSVTVDGTERVAGRDAYKLLIKPRQSGTTVGAVSIAVDAKTGMPLKFTLTPKSGGAAVLDVGFTQVSFARPAASTFAFTPPKGAKVTEEQKDSAARKHAPESGGDFAQGRDGANVLGKGWTSIATFDTGAKGGLPTGSRGGDLGGFLGSLGDKVSGKFGKGTVFSTRLVNALITDDGKVYAGAVTKDALVKAANAGK